MTGDRLSLSHFWRIAQRGKARPNATIKAVAESVRTLENEARSEQQTLSDARKRFASMLFLSDEKLHGAPREDLEDSIRILGAQCAYYKMKFAELPLSDTLEVLTNGTMNDEQSKWVGDGLQLAVTVLDGLAQRPAAAE
jgi:hypothetical protein